MGIYEGFAPVYAAGGWGRFSESMAGRLPAVLERFGRQPKSILDLACGEGTFAVAMAAAGYQVTGLDRSAEMLRLAAEKARAAGVQVQLDQGDLRELAYDGQFDLVTCWFDSLNYLLVRTDLEATFAGACRALAKGGLFVFDMNTLYGLAVRWRSHGTAVEVETPELFVVMRTGYDWERSIASVHITAYRRTGDLWQRSDEEHSERAYTLEDILSALSTAGLRPLASYGSLSAFTDVEPESARVWVVAERNPHANRVPATR